MQLANGARLSAEVVSVEANFDKVPNSDKTCHKAIFRVDDGTEYPGQLCTSDRKPPFETGDTIDIVIKSYTKGIYTFAVEKVTGLREIKVGGANTTIPFSKVSVIGTPRQFALDAAVRHYQNRIGITGDNVLELATKFEEYLREKTD